MPNALNRTSQADLDLHNTMNGKMNICSVCFLIRSLMNKTCLMLRSCLFLTNLLISGFANIEIKVGLANQTKEVNQLVATLPKKSGNFYFLIVTLTKSRIIILIIITIIHDDNNR